MSTRSRAHALIALLTSKTSTVTHPSGLVSFFVSRCRLQVMPQPPNTGANSIEEMPGTSDLHTSHRLKPSYFLHPELPHLAHMLLELIALQALQNHCLAVYDGLWCSQISMSISHERNLYPAPQFRSWSPSSRSSLFFCLAYSHRMLNLIHICNDIKVLIRNEVYHNNDRIRLQDRPSRTPNCICRLNCEIN
jgi:hypothetical protein